MASSALVLGFIALCVVCVTGFPVEDETDRNVCPDFKGYNRKEGESWYEKNLKVQCICEQFHGFSTGGESGNIGTEPVRHCLTFGCRVPDTDELVSGNAVRSSEDGSAKCVCRLGPDTKIGYTMYHWKCEGETYWPNPPY